MMITHCHCADKVSKALDVLGEWEIMAHYPNQEKDGVLSCGCVETYHGASVVLGSGAGKLWQICLKHPDGPGRNGMQQFLREASADERIRFYREGIPAPIRRSTRASKKVPKMSGFAKGKASSDGDDSTPLF